MATQFLTTALGPRGLGADPPRTHPLTHVCPCLPGALGSSSGLQRSCLSNTTTAFAPSLPSWLFPPLLLLFQAQAPPAGSLCWTGVQGRASPSPGYTCSSTCQETQWPTLAHTHASVSLLLNFPSLLRSRPHFIIPYATSMKELGL